MDGVGMQEALLFGEGRGISAPMREIGGAARFSEVKGRP